MTNLIKIEIEIQGTDALIKDASDAYNEVIDRLQMYSIRRNVMSITKTEPGVLGLAKAVKTLETTP